MLRYGVHKVGLTDSRHSRTSVTDGQTRSQYASGTVFQRWRRHKDLAKSSTNSCKQKASSRTLISSSETSVIPMRQFIRQQRPSDPWFDKDCRAAKRLTRRLERSYSAACRRATFVIPGDADAAADKAAAAKKACYDQRRTYRQLRHRKCTEFWHSKLEANQSDSQKLWRLVDDLLGRGRAAPSSTIDVEALNQFFCRESAF